MDKVYALDTVHRTSARLTGTLTAMDDPIPVRGRTAIPQREVQVRASRSSGPGGQHANTTASRIEAVFDVAASQTLSPEQKRRVIARLGPRVVAVAQDSRSQAQNRELALQRLAQRLAGALAVAPPAHGHAPEQGAIKRRQEAKRRQSQRKRDRRRPGEEGEQCAGMSTA